MQLSVHTGCDELLLDENVFCNELHKYLDSKNSESQHKKEIGLAVQHSIYHAVKHKQDPHFELADGWHECVFSRLPSLRCVRVYAQITVHEQYVKWLQCLWLATHMHEVEQQHRGARVRAEVPREHSELYRKSLLFVLQKLKQLYLHIVNNNVSKKKNTQSI
jgi:hypothetical protein